MRDAEYTNQALADIGAIEVRHMATNRTQAAQRVLDELGDWEAETDGKDGPIVCCGTCWHSTPRHFEGCALFRLALMLSERQGRLV